MSGPSSGTRWAALGGAVAVLVAGALHTRLAFDGYGTADLVTAFFLDGIASAVVAAWIAYDRRPPAALLGLVLSVGSLGAFALSRTSVGVLGFRGTGVEPTPDALLSLLLEGAAVVLLAAVVVADRRALVALGRRVREAARR